MKLLSVVAASIAALASAGGSFRGKTGAKQWSPDQNVPTQQSKGKYAGKTKSKGGDKNSKYAQWLARYKNKKTSGGKKGTYGKYGSKYGKKPIKKKCTLATVPTAKQAKYKTQFEALDTDGSGSLDASEFKDMGVQITKAFSDFRKNRYSRPTWHHKSKGKGKTDTNKGGNTQQNPWNKKPTGGNRRNRGGSRFGGRQLGGSHGTKSKGKMSGSDFWKYLQQKGFVHKPTQADKDKMAARRAAGVFKKFDQDGNDTVSLCEYENAMYRTEKMETYLNKYKKKTDDVVVVHG